MKLMMLGASAAQLQGILTAKAMGHTVVTCDYIKDAVGHHYSDQQAYVSTFDLEGALEVASSHHVDGIMTMGTDQPVYTAAYIAETFGLPTLISAHTALQVTNKKEMKKVFESAGIPHVPSILYTPGLNDQAVFHFQYPAVIKPIDSQGQRGVMLVQSPEEVIRLYPEVIKHSRQKEILLEAYYPHEEVTITGWVIDGQVRILTVTDRVTFDDPKHIGICLSHEYPSKHSERFGSDIAELTYHLVEAFQIRSGPLYFQYFIGADGLKVNEVACRIGGAYEAIFVPRITGFDLCDMQIKASLGLPVKDLGARDETHMNECYSVQLFFANPCSVSYATSMGQVLQLEGVIDGAYTKHVEGSIGPIENATSRLGYVIVSAPDKRTLEMRLERLYQVLRIEDQKGLNQIVHRSLKTGGQ